MGIWTYRVICKTCLAMFAEYFGNPLNWTYRVLCESIFPWFTEYSVSHLQSECHHVFISLWVTFLISRRWRRDGWSALEALAALTQSKAVTSGTMPRLKRDSLEPERGGCGLCFPGVKKIYIFSNWYCLYDLSVPSSQAL